MLILMLFDGRDLAQNGWFIVVAFFLPKKPEKYYLVS